MGQPKGLGTIYDNNDTTIEIPLALPSAGKYLVRIRQEDSSRTQETVETVENENGEHIFYLKNYNGHKKLGYGTNIISVFSSTNERVEISGYNRWALRLKEAVVTTQQGFTIADLLAAYKIVTIRYADGVLNDFEINAYPSTLLVLRNGNGLSNDEYAFENGVLELALPLQPNDFLILIYFQQQ